MKLDEDWWVWNLIGFEANQEYKLSKNEEQVSIATNVSRKSHADANPGRKSSEP